MAIRHQDPARDGERSGSVEDFMLKAHDALRAGNAVRAKFYAAGAAVRLGMNPDDAKKMSARDLIAFVES